MERVGILKGVERVELTRLLKGRGEYKERVTVETLEELGRVLSRGQVEEWRTNTQGILEDKKYIMDY